MHSKSDSVDVLVGPFSYEPYAQGLHDLLTRVDVFSVVKADLVDIQQRLATKETEPKPPIVILAEAGSACGEKLMSEKNLGASLVLLDPTSEHASIRVDNPDSDQLVKIIRALVSNRSDPATTESSQVRILYPDDRTRPNYSNQADQFGAIIEWLNLTLALNLLKLRDKQTQRSITGWYVSPVTALLLLGIDPDEASVSSVSNQLNDLEPEFLTERSTMPVPVQTLMDKFDLDDVELRVLLLCLATELDGRFGVAYGVLQDDMTRRLPTLTLLTKLADPSKFAWELRSRLVGAGSLISTGLIKTVAPGSTSTTVDAGIKVSETVVQHFLSQDPSAVSQANNATLRSPSGISLTVGERQLSDRLVSLIAARPGCPILNPVGNLDWFERVVGYTGARILTGELAGVRDNNAAEVVRNWILLSRLYDAALVLNGLETLDTKERRSVSTTIETSSIRPALVAYRGDQTLWANPTSPVLRLHAPATTTIERSQHWAQETQLAGLEVTAEQARYLAATLPISVAEMRACIALCSPSHEFDGADHSVVRRLQQAFRDQNQIPLPPAVRRVETRFGWDDLVVPNVVMQSLQTIAAHVAQAGRVFEEWGFEERMPYGNGLSALFSGPSGTGKTLAARVIAAELGVELLQVDLSKTVSKYIGETEKNLDAAFQAAENVGAMLLFDEADALFGKRTEVKDSHDRHANVEVSYLLQRIESFPGLAVLTTNLKQNIDHAFLRRLRFSVDFPVPNASERESIWRRSFPTAAPLSDELDLAYLARHLKLTGGSIQQISLHAAFAASAAETNIEMSHIVTATRQELVKVGMLHAEKTLEGLAA